MATDIVQSLFGVTPESYQEAQRQRAEANAVEMAKLDPMQRAIAGIRSSGYNLAQGLGGIMGAEDPQLQKISTVNALAKQFDVTTPEGMIQAAETVKSIYPDVALQLINQAQGMKAATVEAKRKELSLAQEEQLRKELSALGPDATQEDLLKVVTKYGDPKTIIPVLQSSMDRAAQREQALTVARERIQAQIDAARERGESAERIAQMQADARKEIAMLTAALKGPSAAVIKAQERADKIAEGKIGLSDTLEVAKTLVNDLEKMGGMTSTSKAPLANLITSLGTSAVGQFGGRMVGTETQAKRDELKSIRLQLLNAVKEATGMSSQQLNSNVELKTWLDSLGAENMTKEANLAILNNITNRYLKGYTPSSTAPAPGSQPKTVKFSDLP